MAEISDARRRAREREEEREKAREARKAEYAAKRASRSRAGSSETDDPHDMMAAAGWDRKGDRQRQKDKAAAGGGSGASSRSGSMDGAHMTREDQVLAHATKLQAENAETLKKTLKVARETTEVGAATIHKLNEQTEQFHRMDNTLVETQDSLTRSERIIRGMKSWTGALSNMFSSGKSKRHSGGGAPVVKGLGSETTSLEEKDRMRANKKEIDAVRADQLDLDDYASRASPETFTTTKGGSATTKGLASASASAVPVVEANARQRGAMETFAKNQAAEDDALDELSDVLGALKEQSQVMNAQLAAQAQLIDGIESKVDNTSARLHKGTRTMNKID